MKESQMQVLFRSWLRNNYQETSAFELKICKDRLFNLKKIELHQIGSLRMVNDGLFFYKISDESFVQKPFDCFTMHKEQAYVVIMWYKPRQPKIFHAINITAMEGLIDDGKKSISEEESIKYEEFNGELK